MEAVDLTAGIERAIPPRRRVEALWLGRIGYGRALVLQREAAARVEPEVAEAKDAAPAETGRATNESPSHCSAQP